MQTATSYSGTEVRLDLQSDPGDRLDAGRASLTGSTARFMLPLAVHRDDVHPDVEALLSLLVVRPFATSVTVARGVSAQFAATAHEAFGLVIGPTDPALAPRQAPPDGIIGLAFSGGADSTAALAVLPPETVLVFQRRVDAPGEMGKSRYSPEAALYACEALASRGRRVLIVDSDVEHIRTPIGFTTDWINGAGLLLLADSLGLDALSWGLIAESAYRLGYKQFVDWREILRPTWGPMFEAVDLPMCQPVAGVSEVSTSSIVARVPEGSLVQSCIRGTVGRPCGACAKCVRKSLLGAALSGRWPDDAGLNALFGTAAARDFLTHYPIKHEDVIAWLADRYEGDHPVMALLRTRTHADGGSLDWLTRYYGPALDLLPERHRAEVAAGLDRYLERMSPEDEAAMRAWDRIEFLADPATIAAQAALAESLERLAPDRPRRRSRLPRRAVRWFRRNLGLPHATR